MATTFPPNFPASDFQYPQHVDQRALELLQQVRSAYGKPLVVTGDWRPPGFVPPGGSNSSLHFQGRAFDLRSRDMTPEGRWAFEAAVHQIASALSIAEHGVELEWVLSGPAEHVHVGFFLDGRASRLILKAS